MLVNPLTLIGISTATSAATGAVETASNLLGGIGSEIADTFGNLLGIAPEGLNLQAQGDITFDPKMVLQNLKGQNLPEGTNPLQQQTLSYIDQILNGTAVIDGKNITITNANGEKVETTLNDQQSDVINNIQKILGENKDLIANASDDQIKGLMATITQIVTAAENLQNPQTLQNAAVANPVTESVNISAPVADAAKPNAFIKVDENNVAKSDIAMPQLMQEKSDPRIMGKDNMKAAVVTQEDKNAGTALSMLDDNDSIFDVNGNQAKALTNGADLTGKFAGQLDALNKNYIDGRFAALNGTQVVRYTSNDNASYGVAKVSKQNGKIEIHLDPASLGKVDIKFDFGTDGKTNLIVSAERKETLDLLQKDAKYFEKILAESGIKADSGSMSFNLKQQNTGAEQFAGQYYSDQQKKLFKDFNFKISDESATKEIANISSLSAYQNIGNINNGLNILV